MGENTMSDNKTNGAWHGIARADIDWHPTIVADRCIGCGLCVTSCGRGVYAFDYEQNKPVVVAPQMCMVGCTTCATLCTQDALEFPSTGFVRQLIREKKLLRQSKGVLRANRDKYDAKAPAPVGV
jgi:NAD-dependent dihydropyrimidine dehydrogenase PreA subunit